MSTDPLLFDYDLPRHLIAQEPLRNRADARLMLVDRERQSIEHWHVRDLPELLRTSDHLVLNNTQVIPAQLVGHRVSTEGRWHGLFLREQDNFWRIVCKTRGKLAAGELIVIEDREGRPAAKLWLVERLTGGEWLARLQERESTTAALQRFGRVPLPHYIRGGQMIDADVTSYQTVFARQPGAVAAPTAGLHFTTELLRQLDQKGIGLTAVTLHVGLGTFRPISGDSLGEHKMHSEWGELSPTAAAEINATRAAQGRVVAIGTTSVRVLETAAQFVKGSASEIAPFTGDTNLFIRPPFQFRAVDSLLTNFHFPRTTLLVLVQTFGGSELIQRAYREAVREEYRFYSYGDAMLIV